MITRLPLWCGAALAVAVGGALSAEQRGSAADVRLMTLDPGHFHAALIQKEMYPGVASRVDVYAPLGWDLFEHLNRVAGFNRRAERPTSWDLEVHTSPDYFERMLKERPGQRRRPLGPERGEDGSHPGVRQGRDPRPRRQAVDPQVCRSAEGRSGAGRSRRAEARRLRHHDRALRSDDHAPACARQRSRGVWRDRTRDRGGAIGLHGERAPPDEGRLGRAEHQAAVVLRHQRAGRGGERHRHAPRGPRAVDALPGQGDRLPRRHQGARRAALADVDSGGRLPPGDERSGLCQGARAHGQGRAAGVPTATRSCRTRSRASTRS